MTFLTKVAMRVNYLVRRHPSRFLYRDDLLRRFVDHNELPLLSRNWGQSVIWDVGASIGKYTTILAKNSPMATVYAFEPNLNSLYYLAYRTARYQNVVVVPNALTSHKGFVPSSYDPDYSSPPTGPRTPAITVEEAILKFGMPTFVKMDIEGGEFQIFEDESSLLRNTVILVSWHPTLTGRTIPALPAWRNTVLSRDISLLEPIQN